MGTGADNVEVGIAVPVPGTTLLPLAIILGALVVASFAIDVYLYKHQRHVVPLPRRPTGTPTAIPPPLSLANWCGHRIIPIYDDLYKVEYDLTLVLPYVKSKDYSVMYKINAFGWVPVNYTLRRWTAPFVSSFIFPQMKPMQAYLFDFEGWENNTNTVRLLNLTDKQIPGGYEIAEQADEALKLNHFDLEDMRNGTEEFKTYHARFTLHLTTSKASLVTCRNETGSCVSQFQGPIELSEIPKRFADAVFVTLGADRSKGEAIEVWQNVSQAVCCEVYKIEKSGTVKMCRVEGSTEAKVCPEKEKVSTCWDYGRGY